MTRVVRLLNLFFVLAAASLIAGCDPPPPSSEELGRIVFSESEVPGANEAYTVPKRIEELKADENEHRVVPGE